MPQPSRFCRAEKGRPLLHKAAATCEACRTCVSKCPRCASVAGSEACLAFPDTLATQQVTDTCPRPWLGCELGVLGKEAERAPGQGGPWF